MDLEKLLCPTARGDRCPRCLQYDPNLYPNNHTAELSKMDRADLVYGSFAYVAKMDILSPHENPVVARWDLTPQQRCEQAHERRKLFMAQLNKACSAIMKNMLKQFDTPSFTNFVKMTGAIGQPDGGPEMKLKILRAYRAVRNKFHNDGTRKYISAVDAHITARNLHTQRPPRSKAGKKIGIETNGPGETAVPNSAW